MHTIRTAAPTDEGEVYRLVCLLEETQLPHEAFAEIFASLLQNTEHCILVCDGADGRLSAVAHLRMEPQLHHAARVAELLELCVDTPARGQGLGEELLCAARRCAAEAGCVQLELVSNCRRTRAHHFYEKQGMKRSHVGFTEELNG